MIGNRMCAFSLSLTVPIICSILPATASQFDGHWRMVALTTRGHCGEIPIDVGISRSRIYSTGGSSFGTVFAHYVIQLVGRVSASGQVRMNAVAGPRIPYGTERFNRFRGSGTGQVPAPPVFAQAFGAPFATDAPPAIESLQAMQSETRSKSTTGVSVEGLPEV